MNTVNEIRERIKALLAAKETELTDIEQKIGEARGAIAAADLAAKSATERTDLAAFGKARADKTKAETSLEMYTARRDQLLRNRSVTEEESDRVIQQLLDYERDLGAAFNADAGKLLRQIRDRLEAYKQEVALAERTIEWWTGSIHASYRKAMGDTLEARRNKDPQAVHFAPYFGTPLSVRLDTGILRDDEARKAMGD